MIFITGASGFLGQGISRYFTERGYEVVGFDRNRPQDEEIFTRFYEAQELDEFLISALKEFSPECLIHLAGNADVQKSLSEPIEDFQRSVQLFSTVLDSVRQHSKGTKIIFSSSAAVYGQPKQLPISEEQQPSPISPYGYHKWMCEILAKEYAEIYGLKVAAMRIFSAYGPGLKKQILWDICCKLRESGAVVLSGGGYESRDFIHRNDIAGAAECILKGAKFTGEVYNVASGEEVRIGELAQLIVDLYGLPGASLSFNGGVRSGDPKNWKANIAGLRNLGFFAKTSLEQGVREYVEWHKILR